MDIDLEVNKVYLPYLQDNTPTQIFFGGSSSGKSYFLAQRCILDVLQGGRNYLVLRKVQRDCKKSVWNEVIKKLRKLDLLSYVSTNKTELTITFPNGYQILFGGLDDRERIKSITPKKGVITDVWLEEATEFEEDDIKQINKRLRGQVDVVKRLILSFNPIIKTHWIYKRYFDNWEEDSNQYQDDRLLILKTTYKDNNFLTDDDIERLEEEDDPYYIEVYLKGNWGVLGNVIFRNWEVRDLSDMEDRLDRSCHGLDFGFSNDPAAVVKQYYDRSSETLYIFDEVYSTGLTDKQLANRVKKIIPSRQEVKCDSAEPKSVKHLRNYGVNARSAKKGPGSIETSYRWLKGITIVLDKRCVKTKHELQVHKWKEDKDGNALPKPQDKDNHAIDAIRYGTNDYWRAMAKGRRIKGKPRGF